MADSSILSQVGETGPERGEDTGEISLEQLAQQLAAGHATLRHPGEAVSPDAPSLVDDLKGYQKFFQQVHRHFRGASQQELALSYSAEWVLDNHYLVQQALRQIGQDLPPNYYRQLPKLASGPLEGCPRVYAVAVELLTLDGAHIDLERVERFVDAYQSLAPLTMGELWALPIMLRLGVLHCLALAISRITGLDMAPDGRPLRGIDLSAGLTDDQVVANSFISLRALSAQDWKTFFEHLSLVERILSQDPAGHYPGMDFDSRDRYRKVVEEIALAADRDELEVAHQAVRLAQAVLDPAVKTAVDPAVDAASGSASEIAALLEKVRRQPPGATGSRGATRSRSDDHVAGSRGAAGSRGEARSPDAHRSQDAARSPDGPAAWAGFATGRMAHAGYYLLDKGRPRLERSLGYRPDLHKRLSRWAFAHPALVYLGILGLLALGILALPVLYAASRGAGPLTLLAVALLAFIPTLTIAVTLLNWIITTAAEPRVLPKMDFSEGIPQACRTLVAVPALLSSEEEVKSLLQQLELHYLRNPDPRLTFALLTDFSDAPEQHMPGDEALVQQAVDGVLGLNDRYSRGAAGPFYLLHRERRWNTREETWMGWERKRGKLTELNRLILGKQETSFTVQIGDLDGLTENRYVITLDADTVLPRDSAPRLVATLAHPLNRAEFSPSRDGTAERVAAGYTILQPRTEISPTSANQSQFTRIYAGDTGLDLYTLAVSDVYQDFFGEGIFVGKGIYDVAAFERSLAGAVPENALLSHDLFEGIHGRAGLVTDIILIEDYPPHYFSQLNRRHRWVRGDWQLLPWLLPRVPSVTGHKIPNRLSLVDRWKIVDNLRRSLVSPSLLLFFIAGWLWLPGSPWFWTAAGALTLAVPLVTDALAGLGHLLRGQATYKTLAGLRDNALRWLLALAFLPIEAYVDLNAIFTTLRRLFITRRGMLRWVTAAQAARSFEIEEEARATLKQLAFALLLAAGLVFLIFLLNEPALGPAALLLTAWVLSPEIAYQMSLPVRPRFVHLDEDQRQYLRRLARRTWLFFEQFVGPEDHWLPPDHFQESPLGVVAHRTSPTNIGLGLVSTQAAYDLGYIGALDLASRLRVTFENLERLERYRGHFLNWYDTRSLEPLPPSYVSVVDSGNLAAGLIILGQSCQAIHMQRVLRWETLQGLLDTLELILELLEELEGAQAGRVAAGLAAYMHQVRAQVLAAEPEPEVWYRLLQSFSREIWEELDRRLVDLVETAGSLMGPENLRRLRIYNQRLRYQIDSALREIELLLPWVPLLAEGLPPALLAEEQAGSQLHAAWLALLEALPATPQLDQIGVVARSAEEHLAELGAALDELDRGGPNAQLQNARAWCAGLEKRLEEAGLAAKALLIGFQDLYWQAETYLREMDFGFLFDRRRQVFHIGYNLELERLDNNYYDLLASEARIASLVAIARGDVPQSHWLHLSRPLTQVDSTQALLSWSGTMFEYLMPVLFLRNYDGTLLDQSVRAAVERHIAYGEERNTPWGISESGYYRFDANMAYQYRAFGVPGLGYKRGLGEDLVITPYASLLALPLRPLAVFNNIRNLIRHNMLSTFGFYEAIDFTPSRLSLGSRYQIVQEYMSHHQGMILISLLNYLQGNIMVERFHADPRIRAVELLLQEQIPEEAPLEQAHLDEEGEVVRPEQAEVVTAPWRVRVQVLRPRVHILSNGRYSVVISSAGSGYSRWQGIDLTRWRADSTLNQWGAWIYVLDRERGEGEPGRLWSAGFQPTGVRPHSQDVYFNAHMAEFRRQDQEISLVMEITVTPEDDVEIRRVTLTNHSERPRRLNLTSYGEVSLAELAADQRHPAFNKLFIESEYLPEVNGLLFRRRPRSDEEQPPYMIHSLAIEQGRTDQASYTGSRGSFLGRGGTVRSPAALQAGRRLAGEAGATLDPIFSLSQDIDLQPHDSVQVAFMTLAAGSREQAEALAGRYHAWHLVERAFEQSRSQAEVDLRRLGLNTEQLERIERLLSPLLYPGASLRAAPEVLAANRKGQPGLWAYGISGDYPILLVRIHGQDDLPLVQELLQAHAFWRERQVQVDLVILNMQGTDYGQELINQLHRLLSRMNSEAWVNRRGGIFLLLADQAGEADRILLETSARVVLDGEKGLLAEQVRGLDSLPSRLPPFQASVTEAEIMERTPPVERPADLLFDNGLGGFTPDGREYVVYLEPGQWTPAPWVNVVANPGFGFLVSEAGSGFSWAVNSGENRLTPWSNDPVSDPPGEALYLRDEETAVVWSPTPLPARAPAPYLVRHGAGYSIFEHHSHGLKQQVRVFAAPEAPVKIVQLRLENAWQRGRRVTVTYYAEWVLGVNRETTQQFIVPEYDAELQALLAHNAYNTEFAGRVAFAAASRPLHGLTADRTEFLGRTGSYARPSALRRIGLASAVEAGVDPCAALQLHLDLQPGEVEEVYFLLGEGEDQEDAQRLVSRYKDPAEVTAAWEAVGELWDGLLNRVQVRTPEPAMDLLLNRWLLYQNLTCRIWGRSAFYQSSGAYGFRDQLQDVMSLVHAAPEIAREHILRAARHQFESGDVLHWWHPPSGRGVRTRFSDDLLWLPYVTAFYVASTGDTAILNEKVPFKKGPPLEPDEDERYGHYETSPGEATLYEHCRRAIQRGSTSGPHNLPLMGSGDWNDGMNRVGIGGRGESVWLGWFLHATLDGFAAICEQRGAAEQAAAYRQRAGELAQALEANAWDGSWYLRAFYDDGKPLGSARNRECQIDAIAQSWAVLSGAGDPQRVQEAMQSVAKRLVRFEDQLILLFTPPFDKTPRDPGYIKGYPPGIRENGGQYTHAALWTVWAFAELGRGDYAEALFRLLNPVYHAASPEKVQVYKVEPYVVAADVYGVPPHTGRGGWTWYTGSAGWMYRLGLEAILGLRLVEGALVFSPCIPQDWPGFEIDYHHGETCYQIRVENPSGVSRGVLEVSLDGERVTDGRIPLVEDGGLRQVRVVLG